MCGIYGMVTDKKNWDIKLRLLKHLAIETEIRGTHATGMAWSDQQHVGYYKIDWKASEFVKTGEFESIETARPNIVIGHNRWATHGDPADNINNHPFKSGQKYFIHNGVIQNYDQLRREYPCASECDSEVVLRVLEQERRRTAGIQRVYQEVQGSFACALLDSRKLRLYLWRNYGNPIVCRYNTKLNLFVFASTSDILLKACAKANVQDYWKSVPILLTDEYILLLRYREGRILRSQIEVEHKQIDPSEVRYWTNKQLNRYKNGQDSYKRPRCLGYDKNGDIIIGYD